VEVIKLFSIRNSFRTLFFLWLDLIPEMNCLLLEMTFLLRLNAWAKKCFSFFITIFFPDGSSRNGLCSMYLNQATIGTTVNAFFRRFVSIIFIVFYYKVSCHRYFEKSNFYLYILCCQLIKQNRIY